MNHNAAHLSFIQTSVQKTLTVFIPPLYRYLPKQYVDDFFETGALRLSCYAQFRKYKDEQQGDSQEGISMPFINDKVNNRSFGISSIVGDNALVLSFTTSKEPLSDIFGDAVFEVFEPIGFCAEIANEISGCQHMMMGQCIYEDNRILLSEQKAPQLAEFISDDGEHVDLSKMIDKSSQIVGPKEYFLKEKKYESQMEFRMIWETNRLVNQPIIINIKDPYQFCRRVEL